MAQEVTEGVELNVFQLQDGMDGVRNAHSTCGEIILDVYSKLICSGICDWMGLRLTDLIVEFDQ